MVQEKAPRKRKPNREYTTPKWQFMYSPLKISIEQLAIEWKGVKGCGVNYLYKRSSKEEWARLRKDHWDKVDAKVANRQEHTDADRRQQQIAEAGDRHIQSGQAMQGVAAYVLKKSHAILQSVEDGEMDPIKALRAVTQLMGKGVEIERKGLGIADRFVVMVHTKEITERVLIVIQKWVKSAEVYENILVDLTKIGKEAQDEVDLLLEAK